VAGSGDTVKDWRRLGPAVLLALSILPFAPATSLAVTQAAAAGQAAGSAAGDTTTQDGAVRLPGVTIEVKNEAGESVAQAVSDGEGRFAVNGLQPGRLTFSASLDGFTTVTQRAVEIRAGGETTLVFDLPVAGMEERVEVTATSTASPVEIPVTAMSVDALPAKLVDQVPARGEGAEALLPLLPGVVRGPDGRLNIKGGQTNQTGRLVNNVDVRDPATGTFGAALPVDAVGSVTLLANPYAAEYGRFSAGVAKVDTRRGSDTWTFGVNNFLPQPRFRDGESRSSRPGRGSQAPSCATACFSPRA
jgi:hypothetical protein